MPFYLSPKTFKQQTKTLLKHWPFSGVKTAHVREVLSQLYGYKNAHHFQQTQKEGAIGLLTCDQNSVIAHYTHWVQKLAELGPMNEIQAKNALHLIWPDYLNKHIDRSAKMYSAQLTFHGQCNDFLAKPIANTAISFEFNDHPSVQDSIQAMGIPHTEVGSIVINGEPVDFSQLLQDNDDVQVYPANSTERKAYLPYKPDGQLTFCWMYTLAGSLGIYVAGFDCLFETQDMGDALLAEVASQQDYILLTRDIGLLKRSKVSYGHWVRNVIPELQFKEIVQYYQLHKDFNPLSRCVSCNGNIVAAEKESVKALVPAKVFEWQEDFRQCSQCQQVYWQGSHYNKIQDILKDAQVTSQR